MATYGIYLYEQVAELDFVGPLQVFAASNAMLEIPGKVLTIAASTAPLTGFAGLRVTPDVAYADAPDLDVLLVPGTGDTGSALADAAALAWIRERQPGLAWLAGVCTGTVILQKAGVLKGRRVTSHWAYLDELGQDPDLTVLPEMRYVRDGNIVTSQGVSAGIDMALWLVGQIHSPDHARAVRRLLQYDPTPPYTAEV